eukprot:342523_1
MSLSSEEIKELKTADITTKDTVFGFIRQTTAKLYNNAEAQETLTFSFIRFMVLKFYWESPKFKKEQLDWKERYMVIKMDFDNYCDEMDEYCDQLEDKCKTAENKYHELYAEFDKENARLVTMVTRLQQQLNDKEQKLKEFTFSSHGQTTVLKMGYKLWSYEDIVLWILSLENGRFKKYEDILSETLKRECITGNLLGQVETSNIKDWGIKQFADKKCLFDHIKSLIEQKPN